MILQWWMHPIWKQMTLLTNWIVQVSTQQNTPNALVVIAICFFHSHHHLTSDLRPKWKWRVFVFFVFVWKCSRALIQWIIRSRLARVHWTQIHSLSFPPVIVFGVNTRIAKEVEIAKWKENTLFIRSVVVVNWNSGREKKKQLLVYNECRRRRSNLCN